jgi:HD-GYP domain-containing protein (c-di-GMP phosphodiesterase class II)
MSAHQTRAVTSDEEGARFVHAVVDALLTAIERYDAALAAHARRVAALAVQIGRDLLYRDDDLGRLRTAALLHDVGKIALSESVVRKAGPLNRLEHTAMRLHPRLGYEIARRAPGLGVAAETILAHHEYFDGTGYPRGLQRGDIPLDARIIAVADAFDVITHERPYKRASSALDAVGEISWCAETQFDPDVAEALNRVLLVAGLGDRTHLALCG